MNKIKLPNRDGANLWLEEFAPNWWNLKVDQEHEYCLKYCRVIGNYEAVDPSGGPMLSVGDTLDNGRYKIIGILNGMTFNIIKNGNN